LYGGTVSAEPTSYAGKERAVRACENIYASVIRWACAASRRSCSTVPSLAGHRRVPHQLANVTGLQFSAEELEQCGLNVMGVERLINHRLGVGRKDDTLPDRWFDEPNPAGPYKGERIDRREFDAMLSRFYEISRLTSDGVPEESWRKELAGVLGA
jgi:aldehyde:ferredoxin oxidoreductase